MKTLHVLVSIFLYTLISLSAQSQSEPIWEPAGIAVSGSNIQQGIEVLYSVTYCNNNKVIFLKMMNHNKQTAIIEWTDAIFTHDMQWKEKNADQGKKTIIIPAQSELSGECSQPESTLIVLINDYLEDETFFNKYRPKNFRVSFTEDAP